MEGNYSLSDIAAATGENSFGGNSSWVLIILFALIFGWGGNGFGNRTDSFGQYATAASQQEILFGQQFQNLDNKLDRLGNGIADATFSLNNSVVNEGRNLGNAINAGFANVQNCCCDLKYDMATQFANANAVTTAQTQKILDALAQNKIDALQAEVSELKTQNMFCGIPKINPYGYGVYPYANGCGCNAI